MNLTRNYGIVVPAVGLVFFLLAGCAGAPEQREAVAPAEEPAEPAVVEYSRGDVGPAGGIVFYVDRRNEHEWTYLEAAPSGWYGDNGDPLFSWGEMGVETGASGSALGTGSENTAMIAQAPGDYAAKLVGGIEINGYNDWFLPSLEEIGEMYENLFRRQLGDLAREGYWTSTERTQDRAMVRNFDTAGQISAQKMHENRVRPIRAF